MFMHCIQYFPFWLCSNTFLDILSSFDFNIIYNGDKRYIYFNNCAQHIQFSVSVSPDKQISNDSALLIIVFIYFFFVFHNYQREKPFMSVCICDSYVWVTSMTILCFAFAIRMYIYVCVYVLYILLLRDKRVPNKCYLRISKHKSVGMYYFQRLDNMNVIAIV